MSSDFERKSTVIHLRGAGEEGVGEDVTYDAVDHELAAGGRRRRCRSPAASRSPPSPSIWPGSSLFPEPPAARGLAALPDLGVRVGRARPRAAPGGHLAARRARARAAAGALRRVAAARRAAVAGAAVNRRLALYPGLRFKLDPTSSWDEPLIAELRATGAVDSVDFKGLYTGSIVDQPPDPLLYRRVVEAFPQAWIEDPKLTPETDAVLAAHRERFSWDAPIHSIADIEALPYPPRMVNIKPSRLGGLRSLLDAYDYCARREIGNYGGGQFELGRRARADPVPGLAVPRRRPQRRRADGLQPPRPGGGPPSSPLAPAPSAVGFRWG